MTSTRNLFNGDRYIQNALYHTDIYIYAYSTDATTVGVLVHEWYRRQVLYRGLSNPVRIGAPGDQPYGFVPRASRQPDLLHDMTRPPATSKVAPVIQEEAEDRRKRVAAATSRG